MKYFIVIKTTRTKRGYATATIQKLYNFSINTFEWSFRFYKDRKHFYTKKRLLEYLKSKYEVVGQWE